MLLSEKETYLLSLRWSKGSQNAACWGSVRPAGGWGHPGCKGQGTAGIKAHWTGYSPNWFSHCSPDLPYCCCCPSGTPGKETTEFNCKLIYLVSSLYASQSVKTSKTSPLTITQQLLSCDFLLFLLLTQTV